MYSDHQHIGILTGLMVAHGVRHVVVCPGNRNAPLAHNFSVCPDIICHSVTDERSAGFVALGLSDALDQPVAVCVTSGSALLATLPAAAEGTYRHRGIVVISADRPVAWIGQLDGQTLPQNGALTPFAAHSVTLPEIHSEDDRWHCNRLVNEAFIALKREPHSSVHINVPVAEPLFGFSMETLPRERVVQYTTWNRLLVKRFLDRRLILVIGQTVHTLSAALIEALSRRMVVLSEQLSSDTLCCTDQMIHLIQTAGMSDELLPETVIYAGGNTVSKRLRQWLRSLPESVEQVLVSEDGLLHDVSRHTSLLVEGCADTVVNDLCDTLPQSASPFMMKWQQLRLQVESAHKLFTPAYSSMRATQLLEQNVCSPSTFSYANSMAVRYGCIYANHYIHCNRGLNGIEGTLSTTAGLALAHPGERIYCVIGDLSAFYDQTALSQQALTGNLRILLLHNSGGAIFHSFPQLASSPACDTLVSAAHRLTAEGLCSQCDITYIKASDEVSLTEGISHLVHDEGTRPILLEVFTDPDTDIRIYKEYYQFIIDNYGVDKH